MKTVLIFDSENEDDEVELKLVQKANSYHSAVTEFSDVVLRQLYKRNTIDGINIEALSKDELIEKIREKFYEIMSDYKIDL